MKTSARKATRAPRRQTPPSTSIFPERLDNARLVDDYALACAAAAAADAEKERLAKQLKNLSLKEISGSFHKAVISEQPGRKTVDLKRMVQSGVVTQQQLDEYTKQGDAFSQIRLYGLT